MPKKTHYVERTKKNDYGPFIRKNTSKKKSGATSLKYKSQLRILLQRKYLPKTKAK